MFCSYASEGVTSVIRGNSQITLFRKGYRTMSEKPNLGSKTWVSKVSELIVEEVSRHWFCLNFEVQLCYSSKINLQFRQMTIIEQFYKK